MMAEVTQRAEQQQESQKTLVGTIISTPFQFLGVMFGSLVGAIIVEWVCLYFFWPDAGWKHAQAMFEYELSWLSQGLLHSVIVQEPGRTATWLAQLAYDWLFVKTGINNQLNNLLLQAPDGRLRLANLMPSLKQGYDLVLIDTQGARSALLEMVVLASDLVVSPLQPNMLTAREFNRGTMQMLDGLRPYERLGMRIPSVQIVINCLDQTNDSRAIHENVRAIFDEHQDISVLETTVPDAIPVFTNNQS